MILVVVPTVAAGKQLPKRPGEIILSVRQILAGSALAGLEISKWVAAANAEAHPNWTEVRAILDGQPS